MSSSLLQGDASLALRAPGDHVPSFLQLSFDPQLLERSGVAALAAHRQQQPAKPKQQSPALQRPPLPPSKAADPLPTLNVYTATQQQKSLDPQLARQQVAHTAPTAALPPTKPSHHEAAVQAAAGQTVWAEHADAKPGLAPCQQQHAQLNGMQQTMQTCTGGPAPVPGLEGCCPAAEYCNGGYGYEMVQTEFIEGASAGKPRSGRGRGRAARTNSEPNSEADEEYLDQHQQQQQQVAKRRKKEQHPLQAESQLLLLGFLSAVVGDNAMLEQCLVHAVSFETQQEAMLQQQMVMMPGAVPPPSNKVGVLKQYQLAQSLAKNVRSRAALSLVWQLPLAFDSARG